MRGRKGSVHVGADELDELEAGALCARAKRFDRLLHDRLDLGTAERHDCATGLELRQEQDVVDEIGHLLHLAPRLFQQGLRVHTGQRRAVKERHQPRQGSTQLV